MAKISLVKAGTRYAEHHILERGYCRPDKVTQLMELKRLPDIKSNVITRWFNLRVHQGLHFNKPEKLTDAALGK